LRSRGCERETGVAAQTVVTDAPHRCTGRERIELLLGQRRDGGGALKAERARRLPWIAR
jgi:hypothetical protein